MKSLVVSFMCLLFLIFTWSWYCNYSDEKINAYINVIENGITLDVTSGKWNHAESKFEILEDDWHEYKKTASFFFSTDKINDADYSIARTKYYINCKDPSNSSGELSCLKEQLKFLRENEKVNLQNIL